MGAILKNGGKEEMRRVAELSPDALFLFGSTESDGENQRWGLMGHQVRKETSGVSGNLVLKHRG